MAEIKVPELAESITEGTIAQWVKKVGDRVEKGEFIVELETDKVNAEIISEEAGVLTQILANEGDTVLVGQVIAVVEAGEGAAVAPAQAETAPAIPVQETPTPVAPAPVVEETSSERVVASPAARKLAREKGIDLAAISPVDPQGRVRVQDVAAHGVKPVAPVATPAQTVATPVAVDSSRVTVEKMTRRRQTIAKKLLEVKQTTAMLTTFNEIDMTNVMALRKRKLDQFVKENDIKLGFMSFFTKAVVAAQEISICKRLKS